MLRAVPISVSTLNRAWRTDEATGGRRWRDSVRALHAYYRRDMRDARDQRELLYPLNWGQHVQRTVPLVWALCREMSTSYVEGVTRRFRVVDAAGDPGAEMDATTRALVDRLYRGAKVDARMRTANDHLTALNCATIHVWPMAKLSGVRLLMLPPHDQEVVLGDIAGDDVRDVLVWRFILPVNDGTSLVPQFALGEITPLTAQWIEGPESVRGKGIFTGSVDDTANPIGRIPVAMLRGSDPGPGEWWPPAPGDLLDAQRAVNHDLTDIGHGARIQAFAQAVATGVSNTQAREINTGPDEIVAGRGDGFDFKYVSPNPDLAGYAKSNQDYREIVIAMNGQNPATFMKSPGITALAKQMEVQDRNAARKRHLSELRLAEQRLYDLVRLWVNFQRGPDTLPDAMVEIEYREPEVPVDRLHDQQALEGEAAHGLTSWARERAKRDGVSLEEGAKRVAEDMALNATRSSLNGAQVTALQGVITAAAMGQMPAETARAMILASFPIDEATVDAMVKPLDGFVATPAPIQAPASTPVDTETMDAMAAATDAMPATEPA